ncbi:MAG: GH1 family beta-glucosidase [Candidatus Goldiibacteriota bacterium]
MEIKFDKDFIFGAATSSYQIEGAWDKDGKGPSIWDVFTHQKGNIRNNDTGDTACAHYEKYREDIELMKELNLKSYRFSVNWARIFPEGRGSINPKGLEFYDGLVDGLLDAGIEPNATLYHWELPYALHNEGGWENREIIDDFAEYASFMFEHFKGRIKLWSTFNETYVVANLGYRMGVFAPGIKNEKKAVQVSHNLNIAHARAVKKFREKEIPGKIGIVHCLTPVHEMEDTPSCRHNAGLVDGMFNRWFMDPSFKGSYPEDIMKRFTEAGIAPQIENGDMEEIKKYKADWLGINYYFRTRVFDNRSPGGEFDWKKTVNITPVKGARYTQMGWEVYPEGIYEILKHVSDNYNISEIYIAENGAAMKDTEIDDNGVVVDNDRLEYIKDHLEKCRKAIDEGVPLKGYYYWSLMDNFEWAHGYDPRFGIIRIDYDTLGRTIKKSGRWYAQVIKDSGFEKNDVKQTAAT